MSIPGSPALSVAATVLPPNMDNVHELMSVMKATMEQLGGTFDALNQTSARVQELQQEPALDSVQQISDLRKQLVKKDRRQDDKMKEIDQLLREVLQHEIVNHLKGQITKQIEDIIEHEVQEQVKLQLGHHIPPKLQESVANQKKQLDEVQYAMKNSEARRANGQLRSNNLHGPMHPLIPISGSASDHFPRNMSDLLNMNAEAVAELLNHYDLPPGESREDNLNRFMRFCNIGYQVVPVDPTCSILA